MNSSRKAVIILLQRRFSRWNNNIRFSTAKLRKILVDPFWLRKSSRELMNCFYCTGKGCFPPCLKVDKKMHVLVRGHRKMWIMPRLECCCTLFPTVVSWPTDLRPPISFSCFLSFNSAIFDRTRQRAGIRSSSRIHRCLGGGLQTIYLFPKARISGASIRR